MLTEGRFTVSMPGPLCSSGERSLYYINRDSVRYQLVYKASLEACHFYGP